MRSAVVSAAMTALLAVTFTHAIEAAVIDTDQFVATSGFVRTPDDFLSDDHEGLDAVTDVRVDGPNGVGETRARGSVTGTLGAYAMINGTNDAESTFRTEAGVLHWTEYTITSDSLAAGDPITGLFTLDIDGALRMRGAPTNDIQLASVFVYIEWLLNDEYKGVLVEAGGDLYADGFDAYEDFAAEDWVLSQDGDTSVATLDLVRNYEFAAKVGDKLTISFDLSVDAWEFTANATTFAEADFYNTAGFALGSETPDVQFTQLELPVSSVPEPAGATMLLALGGILIARRPRKRV